MQNQDGFVFPTLAESRHFVLDPEGLMRDLVVQISDRLSTDMGMFAIRRQYGSYETGGLFGTWTDSLKGLFVLPTMGLGGQVIATDAPFSVDDYLTSPAISHQYDDAVRRERIVSMLAVPVAINGHVAAVAYAGRRDGAPFSDRATKIALEEAERTAQKFSAAIETEEVARVAVQEERNRSAQQLHDSVGALLFAIEAGAKRLGEVASDNEDVSDRAQEISDNAVAAASALRESIAGLVEANDLSTLAALQADVREMERRSGILARLILPHGSPMISDNQGAILVTTCRELLRNVERHSYADRVTLTIFDGDSGTNVVMSDNGTGQADEIIEGVGLTGCRTRVERIGGELSFKSQPDEPGLTVKVWVPK